MKPQELKVIRVRPPLGQSDTQVLIDFIIIDDIYQHSRILCVCPRHTHYNSQNYSSNFGYYNAYLYVLLLDFLGPIPTIMYIILYHICL